MRIVVTGASGFIGRHVVQRLIGEQHDVLGLDIRPPSETTSNYRHLIVDLLDRRALTEAISDFTPQGIIHLAARTDLNERRTIHGYRVNIAGVENLLAAIRTSPSVERAICTSSQLVCAIGYRPRHDEDYCPTTLYGKSKVLTETIWRRRDGGGVTWCIVRPTTIWGPRMNPHYFRFLEMVRTGRYVHVGSGPTLKSYGYVENTAHQYVRLVTAPRGAIHRRTFYLADYDPLVLEDWVNAFKDALGAPPIRRIPLAVARCLARIGDLVALGFPRFPFNSFRLNNVLTAYQVDLAETERVCGPLPFDMRAGVDRTVAWLRERWSQDRQRANEHALSAPQ